MCREIATMHRFFLWGGGGGANVNKKQALLKQTVNGGWEPVIFRLVQSSYKKYTFECDGKVNFKHS
jgi:hypothetical protein